MFQSTTTFQRLRFLFIVAYFFSFSIIDSQGQIFGGSANPRNYNYKGTQLTRDGKDALQNYSSYYKAILGILGIVGMVYALKIYAKWQRGEEVFRDIVNWMIAALVIPIAYGIFYSFF